MQQLELSFLISSSGNLRHLSRVLESIERELPLQGFEVLVGCPYLKPVTLRDFPALRLRWVHFPERNLSALRNQLYALANGRFVYFLDEDCALPAGSLAPLLVWLKQAKLSAYGGPYLSPSSSSILARSYNFLAGLWLESHRYSAWPLPLAGNFLIPKIVAHPIEFPFAIKTAFGGEEIAVCENLAKQNLRVEIRHELAVVHHWAGGVRQFFRRAWLHGRSPLRTQSGARPFLLFSRQCLREGSLRMALLAALYILTVRLSSRCTVKPESDYELNREPARLNHYASL